tara:strand:+ start:18496 stop:20076 length:1581 start_codon:yes stop_codon:yes gene_type:complete
MSKISIFFFIVIFFCFGYLKAQVIHPDQVGGEYYDVLEMMNPDIDQRLYEHPAILSKFKKDSLTWNPWELDFRNPEENYFSILPIQFGLNYNSEYPRTINDGAVWKGKGLNSSVYFGIQGKKGILEYSLAPLIYYSQNQNYQLATQRGSTNPLNYQFSNGRIDYPQRFGKSSFTEYDWAQSEVRLVYSGFTFGASTSNTVWGPAKYNPILRSNNAAGFPHIEIGTNKPYETSIVDFEFKLLWGSLEESDYFDADKENNYRYLAGGFLAFQPRFIKGLKLGFGRMMYKRFNEFEAIDLLVMAYRYDDADRNPDNPNTGNDDFDQLAALSMEWTFPEQGFEAYMEFGKNDFGGVLGGQEPEHSRAYTLGFSKLLLLKDDKIIKLAYERAVLDRSKAAFLYRRHNIWYQHSYIRQGYTHKGQVIGAGIGPGSSSDVFDFDLFTKNGKLQLFAQRIRFNDDYYFDTFNDQFHHDHEWFLEAMYSRTIDSWLISTSFGLTSRKNMNYIQGNDSNNFILGLSFKKFFDRVKK